MKLEHGVAWLVLASSPAAQCLLEEVDPLQTMGSPMSWDIDLAMSDTTLLVGLGNAAVWGNPSTGVVDVYARSTPYAADWVLVQTILPPDPASAAFFGGVLALDGDRALIADLGGDVGRRVYVYERSGGAFALAGELVIDDPSIKVPFGSGVSVDLQGDVAVVGDPTWGPYSGAVHVFERVLGTWSEAAHFTVPAWIVYLGSDVALDGDTIVAGAPGAAFDQGRVYVYEKVGGIWTETAQLGASDSAAYTDLTMSVGVAGDRIVASWKKLDPLATGSVYAFERQGGVWVETQKLTDPEPFSYDTFGIDLDLSGDHLLVGSTQHLAYLFEAGPSGWEAVQVLAGDTLESFFGAEVALAPAGQGLAAIAAPEEGDGVVYPMQLDAFAFLKGTPESLSVSAGGEHALELATCPSVANGLYLVLGSSSGIEPGLATLGTLLPLNLDAYLMFTLLQAGQGPLLGTIGALAPDGTADAKLVLAPGLLPSLVGVHLDHAALVMDLDQGNAVFASETAGITFTP